MIIQNQGADGDSIHKKYFFPPLKTISAYS